MAEAPPASGWGGETGGGDRGEQSSSRASGGTVDEFVRVSSNEQDPRPMRNFRVQIGTSQGTIGDSEDSRHPGRREAGH